MQKYQKGLPPFQTAVLLCSSFMFLLCLATGQTSIVSAASIEGNTTVPNFNQAKKILIHDIYFDHRRTIYCDAEFNERKEIALPDGFQTPSHEARALRMEVEHSVPAENFGRFFQEWREGDPRCVSDKGRSFKGRKCASLVNEQFRLMESDLYNLYPAIGAVNAIRSNHNYAELPNTQPTFGTCEMRVLDRKAEPPAAAKGTLARTALYFEAAYSPKYYRLSDQQKKLFTAWDKMYPVTEWECTRAKRIEHVQGNENVFVKKPCEEAGLW